LNGVAVDGAQVRVARQALDVVDGRRRADAAEVVPAEEDGAVRVREEGAEAGFVFCGC
jgi:hypothetical protein